MSRSFNREKAVPLPKKVLVGLALWLWVSLAVAQNNLGELVDAGAKKLSADEFKHELVQRTLLGMSPSGSRMELMYASSGMIQGSSDTPNVKGVTLTAPIDGVWNVDDSGRICTSMVIGRNMLPLRCQFWFKYKEDYFVADSDSDRYVKVFRRSVKP
jgi:hypothetical protein